MKIKPRILVLFISLFVSGYTMAGGITLGKTRMILPSDATQTSISVRNTSGENTYLIQSWVSDEKGNKSHDFISTPPLFVINPNAENIVRLELVGKPTWANDRETLYYFNSKAIPSTKKDGDGNSLQIATQTVIKFFVRPKALSMTQEEAQKSLSCTYQSNQIVINNPSPYYISMVNIKFGKENSSSMMVPPKSSSKIMTKNNVKNIEYQLINDFGAVSNKKTCPIT
ncbi:fimbrial biogenesis chaperone [Buttiauxella agrestis]|uniref:fimbrial biogenesis chaperone n=1 Tax=Buttiauxella agrestis TaxID=82977 RepID=UPI0039771A93